jgi:hypothetical protein
VEDGKEGVLKSITPFIDSKLDSPCLFLLFIGYFAPC